MKKLFRKPHIFFEDGDDDIIIDPTGEDDEYGSGIGGNEPYACCYSEWLKMFWNPEVNDGTEQDYKNWLAENDFTEPEGCNVNLNGD